MTQRSFTSLILTLVLTASLMTGAVVSGAQQPPDLTETFSWQPYGLTIAYPAGWTLTEGDAAVSLHPANRDVSDGFGPELVLFDQPNISAAQFEDAIAQFAASAGAQSEITARTTLNGTRAVRAALTWRDPAAAGELMLVAAKTQTALGVAYIVRDADAAAYGDALAAVFDSVAFGAAVRTSASVTSVQLPQAYTWNAAGLVLHFPAGWTITAASGVDGDIVSALPGAATGGFRSIQAAIVPRSRVVVPLRTITDTVAADYGAVRDSADIVVAGYDGVAYDLHDTSADPLTMRLVALDVADQGVIALLVFAADDAAWADFRPTVSAFISSIVPARAAALRLVANTQPVRFGGLPQQGEMKDFVWADYGVSLSIPTSWESLGASQDYDLALVSPEAMTTGTGGFIIFQVFPTLGADVTPETALAAIADDAGSSVEPYNDGGFGVKITDDAAGVEQNLVLYPYNDSGAALFVQTSALTSDAGLLLDILDGMTIAPPKVDYDAANASFQASLEANGMLSYGSEDAPVVMREYFSYTCGHCANYALPLENLIGLDVETGNVRLEIAPLASDEKSTLATHATYCAAEQGRGYSVYKALFNDYLVNGYNAAYTPDSVRAILTSEELGLDVDAVYACIEDQKYAPVTMNVRLQFTDYGLTGTPTVLMAAGEDDLAPLTFPDGQIWSGIIPLEALRQITSLIIDEDMSAQDAASTLFGG